MEKKLFNNGLCRQLMIAWVAGLFEGEGCFGFHKKNAKSIQITSTDRDVLDKVANIFGGNISNGTRNDQKGHWKDAFIWRLPFSEAELFWQDIKPFLGQRRLARGEEFMAALREKRKLRMERSAIITQRQAKIFELRSLGYTHMRIAQELNIDRTTVSKILNKQK